MSSFRNTRRTLNSNTSELHAYQNNVYVIESESDSVGDGARGGETKHYTKPDQKYNRSFADDKHLVHNQRQRKKGHGDNIYEPKNNYITWVKLDSERSNINLEREYINEEQRFPKWVMMLDSASFRREYDRQRKLRRGLRSDFRGHQRTFLIEDNRTSRMRPVNYRPVRCRRCRARTVIFICLAFILILACMVSVILTSLKPNAPSTPAPVYKFYEADCSITVDGVMTSGLADKSSDQYKTFSTDFCNAIQATQISESSTYKDTYMGCLVYDIVNGSIMVKFRTLYGTSIPVQMTDVQADIKKSAGKLGKFTVNLSTLFVSVNKKQSTVDPTKADDIFLAPAIPSTTSSGIVDPTATTFDSSSTSLSVSDTPVSSNESPNSINEAEVTDMSMATHQTSAATNLMKTNEAIDMQKSSVSPYLNAPSSDMVGSNPIIYKSLILQSNASLTMSYIGSINDTNPTLETSYGFQSTERVINSTLFPDSVNLEVSGSNILLSVGSSYTGSSLNISSSAARFIGQSLIRSDMYPSQENVTYDSRSNTINSIISLEDFRNLSYNVISSNSLPPADNSQSLVGSSDTILQSITEGRSEILSLVGGSTLLFSSENTQPATPITEPISLVGSNMTTNASNILLLEGSGIIPLYSITSLTSSSSTSQVENSEILSSDVSNITASPSISSSVESVDNMSSISPSISSQSISTLAFDLNSNTLSSIGENIFAYSLSTESYISPTSNDRNTSTLLNTMAVASSSPSISFVGSSINVLPSYTLENHTISEINSSAASTTYSLNNSAFATSSVNLSVDTIQSTETEIISFESSHTSLQSSLSDDVFSTIS